MEYLNGEQHTLLLPLFPRILSHHPKNTWETSSCACSPSPSSPASSATVTQRLSTASHAVRTTVFGTENTSACSPCVLFFLNYSKYSAVSFDSRTGDFGILDSVGSDLMPPFQWFVRRDVWAWREDDEKTEI